MQHVANELESTALDRSAISPDLGFSGFLIGSFRSKVRLYTYPTWRSENISMRTFLTGLHYLGKVGPASYASNYRLDKAKSDFR